MTPTPPRDNREAIRAAVALLPELEHKLDLDFDAPGFRGFKVVPNGQLKTIVSALEALSGDAPTTEDLDRLQFGKVLHQRPESEQTKVERAMDWIDAEADKWAEEINLPALIKNLVQVARLNPKVPTEVRESFIARLEQNIDALARQTFLEAWLRSHDSYKEHLASAHGDEGMDAGIELACKMFMDAYMSHETTDNEYWIAEVIHEARLRKSTDITGGK